MTKSINLKTTNINMRYITKTPNNTWRVRFVYKGRRGSKNFRDLTKAIAYRDKWATPTNKVA